MVTSVFIFLMAVIVLIKSFKNKNIFFFFKYKTILFSLSLNNIHNVNKNSSFFPICVLQVLYKTFENL